MVTFIRSWVTNITAVVVMIAIFETLMPSGKTKKYINLVIGLVVVIAIAGPIAKLSERDFTFDVSAYQGQMTFDRAELEAEIKVKEEKQKEQIVAAYKARIISEVNAAVTSVDGVDSVKSAVNVREDEGAGDFGVILNIYIAFSAKIQPAATPTQAGGIKIPPVTIGPKPTPDAQTEELRTEAYKKLKPEVLSRVSALFSIDKSKITITMLEV